MNNQNTIPLNFIPSTEVLKLEDDLKKISLNGHYTVQELMGVIQENSANYFQRDDVMTDVGKVKEYIKTALSYNEREHFAVMFLDNKHAILKFEILHSGTYDSAEVSPREIIRRALQLNAAALILCHNHPSGEPEPSQADIRITQKIRDAGNIFEIRTLDHFVCGKTIVSFAERGLL